MTGASEWRGAVGDVWAREWQRTDRSFSGLTPVLIDTVVGMAPAGTDKALDIGCGAGSTSFALADRLPDAEVLGIDISPSLVEAAQARAADGAGQGRCQFRLADASLWADTAYRPQLLMSRHGVMFFDDPVAAFTSLHGAAANSAGLVFSCFAAPQDNPWMANIAAVLPHPEPLPPAGVPGPFGFADAAMVGDILTGAGWRDATPQLHRFSYIAGEGESRETAVDDAISFFKRIGPVARAIRELDEDERDALIVRLAGVAGDHFADGAVTMEAQVWIWTARA
jgi:SAM-dependent methyltransferase